MEHPIENVWDYPRPPALERVTHPVRVMFAGREIVRTERAWRVLETSHPPNYYLPLADMLPGVLRPAAAGGSWCEWKGVARYWDAELDGRRAAGCGWDYPDPAPAFAALRRYVALYAGMMDACFVAGERVHAQEGGFYGGWITSWVTGPIKGGPGTAGW